jgi:hypothetical protein
VKERGPQLTRLSLPFCNQLCSTKLLQQLLLYAPSLEAIANLSLLNLDFEQLLDFTKHMSKLIILGLCITEPGGISLAFQKSFLNKSQVDQLEKSCKKLIKVIQNA